jgi:hypothetical protein
MMPIFKKHFGMNNDYNKKKTIIVQKANAYLFYKYLFLLLNPAVVAAQLLHEKALN